MVISFTPCLSLSGQYGEGLETVVAAGETEDRGRFLIFFYTHDTQTQRHTHTKYYTFAQTHIDYAGRSPAEVGRLGHEEV